MITVRISGPMNETGRVVEQIKQLLGTAGKIVRHFYNLEPPAPISPCDVAIIETTETP